jgi:small-conductance mechanosensitive channel/CRP-like cAMP-binding protein
MTYWQHVQSAAGMSGHYYWVLLACVVASQVLAALVPAAKGRLNSATALTLLSLPGLLICGILLAHGQSGSSHLYRWIHFVSLLVLSLGIINLVSVLMFRVLLQAMRVHVAPILRDALVGLAYIVTLLMLMSRHGVELGEIIATSAVITAVIGFSLQDTLGNIMGGVALQLERSIAVGDWIRIGEIEGLVREIRWRQTSIETRTWDTVIIPNSQLMKSQVTVLGRREGKPKLHVVWIYFNVDFRHPPAKVIDAIEGALRIEPIPNVAPDPHPDCVLHEFADSYGRYGVRYWLMDFAKISSTTSEVRTRIFAALLRAGIPASIPAQSVFLTVEGRARKNRKRREEKERRVTALKDVPIFQPLNDSELAELADRMEIAPFRRGEVLVRQGKEAHHLYIICRGDVSLRLDGANGESRQFATLHAGNVFGEMGLLTGEPRSATVTAVTDVVCYRLDKTAFSDILQRRPAIAETIAQLMAQRRVDLEAAKEGLSAEMAGRRVPDASRDFLRQIRSYFNLLQ